VNRFKHFFAVILLLVALSVALSNLHRSAQASSTENTYVVNVYPLEDTAAGGPEGITVDEKGNVWFATGAGRIGVLTASERAITLYGHGTNGNSFEIKARHGSVWFTKSFGSDTPSELLQFDPSTGQFKQYALPDKGSIIGGGLDIDDSGNVWFTETNRDRIGMLDPVTGTFARYPALQEESGPVRLVVDGSSGEVWFTENSVDRVGVLDPQSKRYREYTLPAPGSHPNGLAMDSSGNLWFGETGSSLIGILDRLTGQITEFQPPTVGCVPSGIATDRFGRVWFSELEGNKIGLFDPRDESFEEYEIPIGDAHPKGIAVDSEDRVWFALYLARSIAVLEKLPSTSTQTSESTFSEQTTSFRSSVAKSTDLESGPSALEWQAPAIAMAVVLAVGAVVLFNRRRKHVDLSPSASKYCVKCRCRLPADAVFCDACGARQEK